MKLSEIHDLDYSDADRKADIRAEIAQDEVEKYSDGDFIFKGYDGFEGEGISDFDVKVSYEYEPDDYIDHEFGSHKLPGGFVVTDLRAAEEVQQFGEDGEKVLKTWPKGTDITKLPGWKPKMEEEFQRKADEMND
jgi:hypothetical protein